MEVRTVRNKRILLILLTAVLMFSGCKISLPWTKRVDMTRATPDGLYQQGVEYYQDGSYKKAVDLFQRLKEEYPLSKYSIMGEMGIADSYFSGKQYVEAELAYSEFLNLHPTNENLPYVLYQIGMCHFNQITTIDRDQSEAFKALKELERLGPLPQQQIRLPCGKDDPGMQEDAGRAGILCGTVLLQHKGVSGGPPAVREGRAGISERRDSITR